MTAQSKGDYYITLITATDTFPVRHLVSVLSLFIKGHSAQFRKFATLQSYQGKGYGTLLLNYVITEATKQGAVEIWCNARTEKADYYRTFGLTQTGEPYVKEGKSFVTMTKTL